MTPSEELVCHFEFISVACFIHPFLLGPSLIRKIN
uniref:Uncharacterized protein n=1 Tax=Anguilla anguilla TaxID=7936 RepID=A0A0E9V1I6_ANGAN